MIVRHDAAGSFATVDTASVPWFSASGEIPSHLSNIP